MTRDEINRYIHVEIMERHWHSKHFWLNGNTCQQPFCEPTNRLPDYCSDDSPRSLLNEVVEMVDNDAEVTAQIVGNIGYANFPIRAIAEQIARACVEAHKGMGARSL